tara:strand:- start:1744 stop:2157 length:414 start_codon:yes stop_codon:yes gene_type:complete
MSYSKPKCEKGSKLMRTRCECKKPVKKKTVKKKTVKKKTAKKKKDVYQEHWALVRGQYSHNVPSKNQLKVRRKRIDEAYKLYDKIKKLDKTVPPPKKWRYPPEYCYNVQLQNMIKDLRKELKGLELDEKEAKNGIRV